MNKGFTLIEVLVSLTLMLLAVLFSSRIMVSALDQSRKAAARFRLLEALDYFRNYLSSLPLDAPELGEGTHAADILGHRADWRVETADAVLKRIHLAVASRRRRLQLLLYRSRFILEVSR